MIDQLWEYIAVAIGILVILGGVLLGLLRSRGGRARNLPTAPPRDREVLPGVGDDAAPPRDAPKRSVQDTAGVDTLPPVPGPEVLPEPAPAPAIERPEASAGRLKRLRARLARSNSALGKALLGLLSRGGLDEQAWEDVEDTLLASDLGVEATMELVTSLRAKVQVEGTTDEAMVRSWLREDLLALVDPSMERSIASSRTEGRPAVVLVVGVNGTGKTTTVGKLARVLVAEDKDVVLGAADTFRAAAADQLETWGARSACPRSAPTATGPTPPPSPSTRSRRRPRWRPTWSSSTPPGACTTRSA